MFLRLTRHFARGLADNDLIAEGQDLHASIAGILAAFLVASGCVALIFLGKYNSVVASVHGRLTAQFQTLAEKLAMALDDKTLLIGGAMILMGLLTAVCWDSLALDERDLAVLGPLPVRPATVLLAKAAAVTGAAGLAAVALNALPSLLFPIVLLLKAPVGLVDLVRAIAAHAAAGIAGCAFVYFALSSCRGFAGLFTLGSAVRRLLPLVQFALILGLLSLLLALPVLAGGTRAAIESGSTAIRLYPPLWFLGIEEVLIGRTEGVFADLARIGLSALALSIAAACLVHLGALFLRSHRLGAGAGSPTSPSGRLISAFIERAALTLSSDGRVRASFLFTARTLTRNPRHRLYLAGSLGVGLAVAGAAIASAYAGLSFGPSALSLKSMALAAQLNLVFFLVVGLRIAGTMPADLDAGWVFRFLATPARERHVAGTRAAIFFLAVLPLLVVLAPVHAWLWGGYTAVVHFAFGIVAALALLEVVFTEYTRMPFVSSFTPGRAVLSPKFGLYLLDYFLFAYATPGLEQLLIERTGLFFAWIALFAVFVGRFLNPQSARYRHDRLPLFDDPAEMQQLGLWDTVHGRPAAETDLRSGVPALFGNIGREPAPVVRAPRRAWTWPASQIGLDVKYAIRRLTRNPGFAAFSVVSLALGIGATTALYSVIYSTILRPLNVRELDRLVNLYHSSPLRGSRFYVAFSLPDFEDLRRTQTTFSSIAAHMGFGQVVIANGVGEKTRAEAVSGDYFSVLGVQPAAGRLLQAGDDRAGAPPVAVIDHHMWRQRFGGRSDIAGQIVHIAGHAFEIVGVTPPEFHGVELPNLAPTALWIPIDATGLVGVGGIRDDRENRWLLATGRLAPGKTIEQAQAEIRVIGQRLDATAPIGRDLAAPLRSPPYVSRSWVAVRAADRLVTEQADPGMRRLARLTMAAVTLVLLVACTNLSNLTLARGISRKRETAVRLALGASRWQIVREQLVESAIVAGLGAVAALAATRVLMAYGVSTTFRSGAWISVDVAPTIDVPAVIVGIAATALALVVFGLVPALQLTRGAVSLAGDAGSSAGIGGRWRGRRLLIASQVAVSVALVAIAGLCVRHVAREASRAAGLDLDRLALVRFDFSVQGWSEDRARRAVVHIADEAGRHEDVESVAIVSSLPRGGFGGSVSLTTPDHPFAAPKYYGHAVALLSATPSAFRTLGIPLVAGRFFDNRDDAARPQVVVLNEGAARTLFGDAASAVGREVWERTPAREGRAAGLEVLTVVGIAGDAGTGDRDPRDAIAYVPFAQQYTPSLMIAVRTPANPRASVGMLTTLTRRVEPELGIIDAGTGTELSGVQNLAFEIMAALTGLLGGLSMALAMAGLYGVLTYVVAQRTHEIGVRVALGASTRQIVRLILGEGVRPVVEGLVVGFVIADLAEMAIRPALTKPLPAIDATLLALVPLPFLIAALIACYLPSKRAAAVDPNVALRHS